MTYKEVITMFRAANTAINSVGTFVHGRKPEGSFTTIAATFPLIFLPPFRESTDYKKAITRRTIVLFLLKQDNPGNTVEEREDLIEECYLLKEAFIAKLNEFWDSPSNTYFGKASISEVMATPEYLQMAGTVSGYSISFTLSTKTDC